MNKTSFVGFLLLSAVFSIKGDLENLSDRVYLPPVSQKPSNKYLPAESEIPEHNEHLNELSDITNSKLGYKYNQPKVIDDPLPVRVDYVQPLRLDFVSGKYSPIFKGDLISGLFLGDKQNLELNRVDSKEIASIKEIKQNLNTNNTYESLNHTDPKAEDSIQRNKYIARPLDDVISLNFFAEDQDEFKLFNHDDESELSGSAPVVIFKPGDDVSFSEDATIIDDYEHKFEVSFINDKSKSSETSTETTFRPFAEESLEREPSSENDNLVNRYSHEASHHHHQSHSQESSREHTTSEESENNRSGQGYIYEKPKIPFTF